jgi:hypothetical protein
MNSNVNSTIAMHSLPHECFVLVSTDGLNRSIAAGRCITGRLAARIGFRSTRADAVRLLGKSGQAAPRHPRPGQAWIR